MSDAPKVDQGYPGWSGGTPLVRWLTKHSPEAAGALSFSRGADNPVGPELLTWHFGDDARNVDRIRAFVLRQIASWTQNTTPAVAEIAVADAMHSLHNAHAVRHRGAGIPAAVVAKELRISKSAYLDLKGAALSALRTAIVVAFDSYMVAAGVWPEPRSPTGAYNKTMGENSNQRWAEAEPRVRDWLRSLPRTLAAIVGAIYREALGKLGRLYLEHGLPFDPLEFERTKSYPALTIAVDGLSGVYVAQRRTDPVPEAGDMAAAGWDLLAPGIKSVDFGQSDVPGCIAIDVTMTHGETLRWDARPPIGIPAGMFNPAISYDPGDVVLHGEQLWMLLRPTADAPGASDAWTLYAETAAEAA